MTMFTYLVSVVGGYGDRTWEYEFRVTAENIVDAAHNAQCVVEQDHEFDGWIVAISQED